MIPIIGDIAQAQATILRRAAWDQQTMPAALLDGIERIFGQRLTPEQAVATVLADVRQRGDAAVQEWSQRIDGPQNRGSSSDAYRDPLAVPQAEIDAAVASLDPALLDALKLAAQRLEAFHRKQPAGSWMDVTPGGTLGQIVRPLQRVGIYVPAGSAPLPSSLLHCAIPARVAGVREIVVCTPPDRSTGRVAPLTLAAAQVAGIDAVCAIGGAQAIAAMAYGTESIPRVDKIVGPGGLFVTLAKRQVFGVVGIDGLPGPTETMVIADDTADPAIAAADLLAQAEHDLLSSAILLTPSRRLAERVQLEVGRQLEALSRAEIAAASLADRGGIVVTADLAQAVALANAYAPEHLCLLTAEPWALVGQIENAGGIFVGEHSFEVLGDYVAGPSHVMPTEGTARFASPLSVADFVKRISLIALGPDEGRRLSGPAALLADGEGLTAHAAAARALGEQSTELPLSKPTSHDIEHLFRPELATMQPYTPIQPFEVVSQRLGRPPEQIVKLDANENPYGPAPRVVEAMAGYPWLHIYPDPQSTELRAALADYVGVPAERILAGHGADELIDLLGRLLLSPGDAVIDCPPTFGMYAFSAAVNGACLINVPRRADFSLDVDAVERIAAAQPASGYDDFGWLDTVQVDCGQPDAAGAEGSARYGFPHPKLLFLCSPNNPDGGLLAAADLERLLRLPLVVAVDEAYIEFARPGASFVSWVAEHDNLVVLRTFSKWAGLGGLRVGYGVFPPAIIEQMWKIKQPYNVNVAGTRAAIASLAHRDYLLGNVAKLLAERERLYTELARFDFLQAVPGSQSNFILCRVIGRDARLLKLTLEQQGVLVRHFAKPGLDNCIRISVGRPADSEALLAALVTCNP